MPDGEDDSELSDAVSGTTTMLTKRSVVTSRWSPKRSTSGFERSCQTKEGLFSTLELVLVEMLRGYRRIMM
jgi:hypothetical protein